jgi:hypothetical protein
VDQAIDLINIKEDGNFIYPSSIRKEVKKDEDFVIEATKFNRRTMKPIYEFYLPNIKEKKIPKSETIKSIAREFNISEKRVVNILSDRPRIPLGKEVLFLMPDGNLNRYALTQVTGEERFMPREH